MQYEVKHISVLYQQYTAHMPVFSYWVGALQYQ